MEVSHLLVVDDTLILYDTDWDQLEYLSWVLIWLEAISRLKINLGKSELIPIEKVTNVEGLAFVLGYGMVKLPTTYSDLPSSAPCKSLSVYDVVEERFQRRSTMWKINICLKEGDLCWSKVSFPFYLMSLFIISRRVS